MKQCTDCLEVKDSSSFYKRTTNKDGLRSECKICSTARNKKQRESHRVKLLEIVELVCEDCGIVHNDIGFFDFHHKIPGTKEANIGSMMAGVSWSKVIEELGKCGLLCPNCHRLRHIKENN